jgi:chromosome segregation ATPase
MLAAQLLLTMSQEFEAAKKVLLEIDKAWQQLSAQLTARESEILLLIAGAEKLGAKAKDELTTLQARIKPLRAEIDADPLGAVSIFVNEIDPLYKQARANLDQCQQQSDKICADFALAKKQLAELNDCQAQYQVLRTEANAKIKQSCLAAPSTVDQVEDLNNWLKTLLATFEKGNWKAAQVGLNKWQKSIEQSLKQIREQILACKELLEELAELQGRFSALKVKANTYASRGKIIDSSINRLADETTRILQNLPVDLVQIRRLITDYESQLKTCLTK